MNDWQVDVLVNNAGVLQQGYFLKSDFRVTQKIFDVNLLGTLSLTRLVADHMRERNIKGLISVVSSMASIGIPNIIL